MKKISYLPIVMGIIACLCLAVGAFIWATGLIDSVYAYRSPLHDNPPTPGKPVGPPLTRSVVFVLVDALRLDTSLKPEIMPFLNELRSQGAWAVMHSRPPSYSDPSYSVLLTGAWPDLSDGPTFNVPYEETPTLTQDNIFLAAKRNGLNTALSGYYWFEKLVPQQAVDVSFYTPGEDQAADRQVVDAALPWLEGSEHNLVLIHLDQVDYAGHYEGGPRDPRWDAAARRADDLIREIASQLDLSRDTLFVASDHGQIDQGGHGGHEPVLLLEPFVLVGAGVIPGEYGDVNMVDVAPTLSVLVGANIPAATQGHVLEEMLTLSEVHENALPSVTYDQQKQLLEAYQRAIGVEIEQAPPMKTSAGQVVDDFQAALEATRWDRLRSERLRRAVIASALFLLPLVFLIWKRGKDIAFMLVGALFYHVLFHFRYATLDRLPYSLSWVDSQEALIQYIGVTAAIALGLVWSMIWLALKAWLRKPRQAAEFGLGLTLTVIYSLSLPPLWSFVLNGAFVTWTLPDFPSLYLGFISVLQILVVAVLGLAETGIAALISRFAHIETVRPS